MNIQIQLNINILKSTICINKHVENFANRLSEFYLNYQINCSEYLSMLNSENYLYTFVTGKYNQLQIKQNFH